MGVALESRRVRFFFLVWLVTLLASAALPNPLHAQAHLWSKRFGSTDEDYGYAVAVDSGGNVLVTGFFRGTVDFGGGNLTSAGDYDIFVAKYSGADGSHLWSKSFGSTLTDQGVGVAVDGNGDVVVTGVFAGTVDFGGGNLTSAGDWDIFVAKYSGADGSHLWSKRFGSTGRDVGVGVAVDSSRNAVLTGYFQGTVNFGGGGLTSAGLDDIFVAKYSGADGSHLWSNRFGSTSTDGGLRVAVDSSRNVVLTGSLRGTVNFGGGGLASAGGADIFVAKYSGADGSHLWSKRFGSTSNDFGRTVAVDSSSNVVLTGTFQGTVNFGGGGLTSAGLDDIFVAKYSGVDGSHLWSERFGSTSYEEAFSLAVDGSGNVVLTGYFNGTVDFGGGGLTSAGNLDIVVAKYSGTDGSHIWSRRFGSTSFDYGYGVAVDGNGNAVVTGAFNGTVDFGGGGLTSAGGGDIFVVKLSQPLPPGPAVSDGGVVNHASFAPSPAPVAPGSIAAVFGTNLNDGSTTVATSFGPDGKLGTALGGASVTINNTPAPMFYSTPGQLGVQIPFEAAGLTTATVQVTVGGQTSVPRTINLDATAPGIFTLNQLGTGIAGVMHENGITLVTAQNPARPNEVVTFFATGFGTLTPPLATGAPATGNQTVATATVTVDGIPAEVQFSGATAGFVGLNHFLVRIPPSTRTASDIPVVLTIGGKPSNSVTIPVSP